MQTTPSRRIKDTSTGERNPSPTRKMESGIRREDTGNNEVFRKKTEEVKHLSDEEPRRTIGSFERTRHRVRKTSKKY